MSVLAVPRSVRITGYVLAVALALAAALANGMFAHSPGYAATTVPVHMSQTPSKDASFPLENAVASGELYAFTLPVVGVERISFWLDAEPGTTEPVSRTDGRWGALNGVDEKGAVKPVNTDKLAHGRHLLVVRALFEDGSVSRTDVEFRVVHKPVLFVSQSPDRSDPVRLDGTTLTGRVYIFASAGEEASRVAFWRDDLAMAGRQARIEKTAPFDLKGGTTTQADPWATQQSPNGEHSVAVKVTTPDGVLTAAATFAVKNPPKLPKPAPSTATAAPTAGAPTASVPVVTPKPTATTSPKPTTPATPKPTSSSPTVAPPPLPAPPSGAKPNAASTGVQPGVSLTPSGSVTVTKAGTVLQNLDVDGVIVIAADDVTVRNVRVTTDTTSFGIYVQKGFSRAVIDHVDIQLPTSSCSNAGVAGGDYTTVRSSDIRGCGDGIKAWDYGLYEGNYIHTEKPDGSDKHLDGIQGSGKTNYTIRNNNIDQPISAGGNAAVFIQAYNGASEFECNDLTVENNWLNGGNYTVFMEDGKTGSGYLNGVMVRGNKLGTDYRYGPKHLEGDTTWSSNLWEKTGLPLT